MERSADRVSAENSRTNGYFTLIGISDFIVFISESYIVVFGPHNIGICFYIIFLPVERGKGAFGSVLVLNNREIGIIKLEFEFGV